MKKPTQHQINRIMIGNQLFIMRSFAAFDNCPEWRRNQINFKVNSVKQYWMDHYGEEVGFEIGDDKTIPTLERIKSNDKS